MILPAQFLNSTYLLVILFFTPLLVEMSALGIRLQYFLLIKYSLPEILKEGDCKREGALRVSRTAESDGVPAVVDFRML